MSNGHPSPPFTIVVPLPDNNRATGRWRPIGDGPETTALANLVMPQESRSMIIQEAINILQRCVPPGGPDSQETGLVVGHVQSGKTMSFTTIAALARDNGYRMVIVITGTKRNLLDQSRRRLIRDLRLETRTDRMPWRHIPDPTVTDNAHISIQNTLADWNDHTVPDIERKTILITVMKHHGHLQKLINVLRRLDLHNTPTLVIDDEGDQAGLNARVNQNQQSTTYRRLLAIKSCLPHHTFLQYTATPQAPLLINIVDVLSPGFAEVLTPGAGYLGGPDFFGERNDLVRVIPQNDILSANNPINEPPPSLIYAMKLFFLGVAAGLSTPNGPSNRSMMVHPSQRTDPHRQYVRWVISLIEHWKQVLDLGIGERDYLDLISEFREAYLDLQSTQPDLLAFDALSQRLRHALRRTEVREINSRGINSRASTNRINWPDAYSWILVGGQAMDRGFTVEGLTVTYMPRSLGLAMADTLQQRGRFFGYKRSYRGFCRVFLETNVRDAFQRYVRHEEDIRAQLIIHRDTNLPLSEWKRQFFLDRTLRPTRDNVVDIAYQRVLLGNGWLYPESPHESVDAALSNRVIMQQFRSNLQFAPYNGIDRRRDSRRNLVSPNVPLQHVHENLLTRLRFPRLEDSQRFAILLRVIQWQLIAHPNELCSVFLMAEGFPRNRRNEGGKINYLFQGRQTDAQGITYPGDRAVRADEGVSIQIGYLNIGPDGAFIAENVPIIAVWIPDTMAQDAIDQPQGGRPI